MGLIGWQKVQGEILHPEWGRGPWSGEPDEWETTFLGLRCRAHRAWNGAWNAYIALPLGHPWIGIPYDAIPLQVHGGLTYSAAALPMWPAAPGWIIGWDYAHWDDLCPRYEQPPIPYASYKTLAEVVLDLHSAVIQVVKHA